MYLKSDAKNFPQLNVLKRHLYAVGFDCCIAGGCFKNLFANETVKDIDVFFYNKEAFELAVRRLGINDEYTAFYTSDKVYAFRHVKTGFVLELVRSIFGEPMQILNAFDFTITKFAFFFSAFDPYEDGEGRHFECLCSPYFFQHLYLKQLTIDDACLYPIDTFNRMFRYAKYGYLPCFSTKKRIVKEIFNSDIGTLEKLNRGFYEVLDQCRNPHSEMVFGEVEE